MKIQLMGTNDFLFDPKGEIAKNRGLNKLDDLNATEEDLNSPSLFKNMDKAVDTLKDALDNRKRIHIIIDSDCDGISSSALLYLFLTDKLKYPKSRITYNTHPNKEHGIKLNELKRFYYDLLIVPDAGSNDFEEQKELYEQEKSIIVLDHHILNGDSNYAIVVNSKDGQYPNPELSGVGVTYQFCKYFAEKFFKGMDISRYLDLVALGLISDMIDTRVKENRYFISEGLSNVTNPFLKGMIEKNLYGKQLILNNISFYIAPYINAVHRVGTSEEKINLFKAFVNDQEPITIQKRGKEPELGYIAQDMVRQCTNIKSRQDRERDSIVESIQSQIDTQAPVTIIELPKDVNRVYFGLIANNLANRLGKPTIIVAENSHESISGSGRGYELSGIIDFRQFLLDSNLFIRAEGHNNAFGLEFKEENYEEIVQYFKNKMGIAGEKIYHVDFSMDEANFTKDFIKELDSLIPLYGQGFKEPYVHVTGITLNTDEVVVNDKKTVLKYNYKGTEYCWFYPNEEVIYHLARPHLTLKMNVVGRASINDYKGKTNPQLVVDSYEVLCYTDEEENDMSWF